MRRAERVAQSQLPAPEIVELCQRGIEASLEQVEPRQRVVGLEGERGEALPGDTREVLAAPQASIMKALIPRAPLSASVIANSTMYRATGPEVIQLFLPLTM